MLLPGLLMLIILTEYEVVTQNHPAAVLTASQCFNSQSRIPKVMFGCASPSHMIKILRAFHGARASGDDDVMRGRQCDDVSGDPLCSYCPGDCVDDSINEVYDWSSCIGSRSCVRTVLQSYAPSCPGPNKFTHYLQVDYQCIPREDVLNVCRMTRRVTSAGGELTSPNYPGSYPSNVDCMCTLSADDPGAKLVLSLYDLVLQTKRDRCRADWLMLRQGTEKHRHCGVLTSGTQNLTTTGSVATLQFHSDDDDVDDDVDDVTSLMQRRRQRGRNYKGFWLRFEADRRTSISVDCRSLDAKDPAAIEAKAENEDYEDDPTPPPQPPPSPLIPPPASADLDFRSRDVQNGATSSADDENDRRQEVGRERNEMDLDVVMRDRDMDLWARTTARTQPGSVDTDSHFEVSSSEERRVVPSDSAASGAIYRLLPASSLSFLVSGTVIVQLY